MIGHAYANERVFIVDLSTESSGDDAKTNSISIGSDITKNGFLNLSVEKTSYEDENEESEGASSFDVSYSHDFTRIVSSSLYLAQSNQSEYIKTSDRSLSLSLSLNSLWNSYLSTAINFDLGARDYDFFRDDFNLASADPLDQEYREQYFSVSLSQEIIEDLRFRASYTKSTYNEDIEAFLDNLYENRPVLLSFLPNFEAMLVGFIDKSYNISLSYFYKKVGLVLGKSRNITLYASEVEDIDYAQITYSFSSFDLYLKGSKASYTDEVVDSNGIGISLYF